jgi:hypothetical protein
MESHQTLEEVEEEALPQILAVETALSTLTKEAVE